ncbi:MAG: LPS assembly lipoprotein LptE [Pseudomonadota bacterium]
MQKTLFTMALLFLASCGFHPVYGVNKYTAVGVEEKLAQTQIGSIPDREGQYLRNALIDRFYRSGRPANPRYSLTISEITESLRGLDVTIDSDTTRGQLALFTSIQLIDKSTNEKLIERNLKSIASYNIIASEFANRVSEQNSRENALNDLARQIEEQLALYFKRQP